MNKKLLLLNLFISPLAFAQVGVNTNSPKTTLDVSAKRNASNGLEDKNQYYGLQAPRLTKLELQSIKSGQYSTDQKGALIYITDATANTGSFTQTANITTVGYYYFDGSVWQKLLISSEDKDINTNIYTDDGTITGARTVNLGLNTLTFSGENPDGVISQRNSSGTDSPAYFSLRKNNGATRTENAAVTQNTVLGAITFAGSTATGFVGNAGTSRTGIRAIAAEGFTASNQGSHLDFLTVPTGTAQNYTRMRITSEGNVGIGTSSPTTRLHVNGQVRIADGTQGVDKILRSDANGNASWFTPAYIKPVAVGNFSAVTHSSVKSTGTSGKKYSNVKITLTKGKYIVNAGLTFYSNVTVPTRFWLNMYLSTSTTTLVQSGFTHLGPAGNNVSYAGVVNVLGSNIEDVNANLSFISGSSVIDVTADNVTIYILIDDEYTNYWELRGHAWENYFYAIPLN